jgi:ankyrin repeat protein
MAEQEPVGEPFQESVLIAASRNGHLEVVRLLLEGGADPRRERGKGHTPLTALRWAASTGHLEMLRLLLGHGAAVDTACTKEHATAFHYACLHNHAGCVEALARAGCDIGLKTKNGLTGREIAEKEGSKDTVRRLRALARQAFVGVLVELAGLVGAAEHNGNHATVRSRHLCLGGLRLQSVLNHSHLC